MSGKSPSKPLGRRASLSLWFMITCLNYISVLFKFIGCSDVRASSSRLRGFCLLQRNFSLQLCQLCFCVRFDCFLAFTILFIGEFRRNVLLLKVRGCSADAFIGRERIRVVLLVLLWYSLVLFFCSPSLLPMLVPLHRTQQLLLLTKSFSFHLQVRSRKFTTTGAGMRSPSKSGASVLMGASNRKFE